ALLAAIGVPLAGFYYCPHHPDGVVPEYAVSCLCRKPSHGLIIRAGREHDIDRAASWFVGDILDDIEAGNRAGSRTLLIDNGGETLWEVGPDRIPDAIARDLAEAARVITQGTAEPVYQPGLPVSDAQTRGALHASPD
ncbi:MAG: HAD-IIIA family hydrolase, partial [Thermomicrobia bacterium]|nr:HAD-IIIA family hydrolase [Thermomicrobia bacterium]